MTQPRPDVYDLTLKGLLDEVNAPGPVIKILNWHRDNPMYISGDIKDIRRVIAEHILDFSTPLADGLELLIKKVRDAIVADTRFRSTHVEVYQFLREQEDVIYVREQAFVTAIRRFASTMNIDILPVQLSESFGRPSFPLDQSEHILDKIHCTNGNVVGIIVSKSSKDGRAQIGLYLLKAEDDAFHPIE